METPLTAIWHDRLRHRTVRSRLAEGSRVALSGGIDLYRGLLLNGLEIPEEAWSDWLSAERQRLESMALDAMVRLSELEVEAGSHEFALCAANRAITRDPLREDAHRLVMRALLAGGRRADALKHYQESRRTVEARAGSGARSGDQQTRDRASLGSPEGAGIESRFRPAVGDGGRRRQGAPAST